MPHFTDTRIKPLESHVTSSGSDPSRVGTCSFDSSLGLTEQSAFLPDSYPGSLTVGVV